MYINDHRLHGLNRLKRLQRGFVLIAQNTCAEHICVIPDRICVIAISMRSQNLSNLRNLWLITHY